MVKTVKSAISMVCPQCRVRCHAHGKNRNGLRRFLCPDCKKTLTEPHRLTLGEMYVSEEKAIMVVKLLVEGNSIRSIQRITGVDQNTIMRILVLAGDRCEKLMGRLIVNVPVKDVEADEIWGYVGKKEGHKMPREANNLTIGDQYCFVAIERHTKLVLNFALGRRDTATTQVFIEGLRAATSNQSFQITTDGFKPYVPAICDTLGDRVSFAQLIKVYRNDPDSEHRYSPGEVVDTEVVPIMGDPDTSRACTSIVERQNLTIRMQMRRLTRLTNAFSKKWENLWAAYCLHFAYYNFCRVHRSLRVTPGMEAGITDHIWEIKELLA